jgi:hypothetical protein
MIARVLPARPRPLPVSLPERGRGRLSTVAQGRYEAAVKAFCGMLTQIASRLDFAVSSRGWAYILEGRLIITKGQLDAAQRFINSCRKSGALPLDICRDDDEEGSTDNLEQLDDTTIAEEASDIVERMRTGHEFYTPMSFWEDQRYYVEMVVEKVDLLSLFGPVCAEFYMPITNLRGWSSLNKRARVMRRLKYWQARGKIPVLLVFTDLDPGGLIIARTLRDNLIELADAVGWDPDDMGPDALIIERFGLDEDFVDAEALTWIDNLITSSGKDLANRHHADYFKDYVQNYLRRFGKRKVEANALVVRPNVGRKLCRDTILKYVSAAAPSRYRRKLDRERIQVRDEVRRILGK